MNDVTTGIVPDAAAVAAAKLQLLGATDAATCVGEFCELPAHREQAVMNRRVDLDAV